MKRSYSAKNLRKALPILEPLDDRTLAPAMLLTYRKFVNYLRTKPHENYLFLQTGGDKTERVVSIDGQRVRLYATKDEGVIGYYGPVVIHMESSEQSAQRLLDELQGFVEGLNVNKLLNQVESVIRHDMEDWHGYEYEPALERYKALRPRTQASG